MAAGLLFVFQPSLRAQDAAKFVGSWKATTNVLGFEQTLEIANAGGKWSIDYTYKRDGAVAGSAVGEKVGVANGGLSYVHKYTKFPVASWKDRPDVLTLRLVGDQLELVNETSKSLRKYERVGAPKAIAKIEPKVEPKAEPKVEPKAELDEAGTKLLGTFAARVDRMFSIFTIAYENGEWRVSGLFKENGRDVGGFDGADFRYDKGVLTFKQKFFLKPRTEWKDDEKFTIRLVGNAVIGLPERTGAAVRSFERIEVPTAGPIAGLKKDDPRRFVGAYRGTASDGTLGFVVITESGGNFSYHATWYNSAGRIIGTTVGVDIRVVDGNLVLVHRHLKKPHASWHDSATVKLELTDNTLHQTRQDGGRWVGSANFTRVVR
jgi:hypothetical protein